MEQSVNVRISRDDDFEWLVWLGETIAARFKILGDALDFAALVECSPRARMEAREISV